MSDTTGAIARVVDAGDVFVVDINGHWMGDRYTHRREAEKEAEDINKALHPLVVRRDIAEKMAYALTEAAGRCFCSVKERLSGHRVECATPLIEEALSAWATLGEGTGEGKGSGNGH